MHLNFLYDAKIIRVENASAAAQTEVVTDVVDMQGFDSVAFVALLGDVTSGSVLTLTLKTNSANSVSSPTPVTTEVAATYTAGASDADNKMLVIDAHQPRDRYVFASLTRTTANAVVDGIIAILYNAGERPVTIDATVLASEFVNDPDAA